MSSEDSTRFEFLSEGPKGTIKKIIHYQKITNHFFNLAFGDRDEERKTLVDLSRTNINDKGKVLATVAFTIFEFMSHHANAVVIIQGATLSRTRLYQMGIAGSWREISALF